MYNSNGKEKNPEDRIRRNKERYVIDYVEADGRMHGPPLPRGQKWCAETKTWWHNWRKSPQAMLMTATDWDAMLETALLHNMLWSPKDAVGGKFGAVSATQLASEIRQRVGKFGATYEDRKKLRMAVETPQSRANAALDEAESIVTDYAEMFANEETE